MKVKEIMQFLNQVAPFETQLDFDNSGLLVGHPENEVQRVLFALDVTSDVLDEAEEKNAELIITHHPLMFSPRKRMTEADTEGKLLCRMIRDRISHIAMHTNLDRAAGGTNDTLAALLGLTDVRVKDFYRFGVLPERMTAERLQACLAEKLHTTVRLMGRPDQVCSTLGLCTGAGGNEWEQADLPYPDAFLSGEIKHHHAIALAENGIVGFECGHFATEEPGIFALADTLQMYSRAVQYPLFIFKSGSGAYGTRQGKKEDL